MKLVIDVQSELADSLDECVWTILDIVKFAGLSDEEFVARLLIEVVGNWDHWEGIPTIDSIPTAHIEEFKAELIQLVNRITDKWWPEQSEE